MAELTEEQIEQLQTKVGDMEKELNELRPLKESSVQAKQEYETKENAWLEEKKVLEQAANPNWLKTREVIKSMKSALKEKGVETDEDGNITNNPQKIDVNDIIKKAQEAATQTIIGGELERRLSIYDGDGAKLVRHFYNKLTTGETVTLENIGKFIQQAHNAAEVESGNRINPIREVIQFSGGQGPRNRSENEGKIDDARAKEIGARLGLKFVKGEEQK